MSSEASGEAFINMSTSVTGADYGEAAAKTTRLASLSTHLESKCEIWLATTGSGSAVLLSAAAGYFMEQTGTYRDGDSLMTYHLPTKAGAAPMAAGHSLCVLCCSHSDSRVVAPSHFHQPRFFCLLVGSLGYHLVRGARAFQSPLKRKLCSRTTE